MAADPHDYKVDYQSHEKESPEAKLSRLAGSLAKLNYDSSVGRSPQKSAPVVLGNRETNVNSFMSYQDTMRQKAMKGGGPPPSQLMKPGAEAQTEWGPPREQQVNQVQSIKKAFNNARLDPVQVRQHQERQQQEQMMWQMMQDQANKGEMKAVYMFLGLLAVGGLAYWGYSFWTDSAAKAVQLARMQALYAQLPPAAPVLPLA